MNLTPGDRILRRPEVSKRTGLGRSTIYNKMRDGVFPKTISLGGNRVGWLESDIDAWIQSRIEASQGDCA